MEEADYHRGPASSRRKGTPLRTDLLSRLVKGQYADPTQGGSHVKQHFIIECFFLCYYTVQGSLPIL